MDSLVERSSDLSFHDTPGKIAAESSLARSRADVSLGSGSANRQQFGTGMFGFGPNDRLSCSAGWCIYNALSARSALKIALRKLPPVCLNTGLPARPATHATMTPIPALVLIAITP